MAGFAAGLALCGVFVGGDYGATLNYKHRVERDTGGAYTLNEVGPVARHGLALGAGVKGGLCVVGEVLLRKRPKQRRTYRILGAVGTGAIVAWTATRRTKP